MFGLAALLTPTRTQTQHSINDGIDNNLNSVRTKNRTSWCYKQRTRQMETSRFVYLRLLVNEPWEQKRFDHRDLKRKLTVRASLELFEEVQRNSWGLKKIHDLALRVVRHASDIADLENPSESLKNPFRIPQKSLNNPSRIRENQPSILKNLCKSLRIP